MKYRIVWQKLADAATANDAATSNVRTNAATLGRGALGGLRVLVVEDDQDTRELLEVMLSSFGAVVVVAASGKEALLAHETFAPDVLVSDIGMPDLDGYDLLHELRKLRPSLPAIALTAHAHTQDVQRALVAGFDEHVAKPVRPETLIEAIAMYGHRDRAL